MRAEKRPLATFDEVHERPRHTKRMQVHYPHFSTPTATHATYRYRQVSRESRWRR